jgi:ribosomal-protein-alanine N-acetyltransferase
MNDPKDHHHLPELVTKRLVLRKLSIDDAEQIFFLRTDPIVNQYVKRSSPDGLQGSIDFIKKGISEIEKGELYSWGITLKGKKLIIGTVTFWNLSRDKKKAELGYDLSPEYHRKGYMHEVISKVIEFGFIHVGFDLIEAYTERENMGSIRLLEKNGFIHDPDRTDDENPNNDIYILSNQL